jgi:hypothetical protein
MVVFGSSDLLTSQEESVIRTFFDRNGFTVHAVKLDRAHTHLTEVEIIPPEEMVRMIARQLKAQGFRVVDDSEKESKADLAARTLTLSALARSITILFSEHVHQVVATTRVKMNKEGNRLLHWLPRIVETLEKRVSREVVDEVREAFEGAYAQFYAKIGKSAEISPGTPAPQKTAKSKTEVGDRIPAISFPDKTPLPVPPSSQDTGTSRKNGSFEPYKPPTKAQEVPETKPGREDVFHVPNEAARAQPPVAATPGDQQELVRIMKELDAAEVIAKLYKKLVKAHASRCVRNCENLLEDVNRLFRATATCVMVKVPHGKGVTIHAQAGKPLLWGEGGGAGYPVSTTVVASCIRQQKVITTEGPGSVVTSSMAANQIESAAAAPIILNEEIVGILYVDRREGMQPFDSVDSRILEKVSRVFHDFPDLTLGLL